MCVCLITNFMCSHFAEPITVMTVSLRLPAYFLTRVQDVFYGLYGQINYPKAWQQYNFHRGGDTYAPLEREMNLHMIAVNVYWKLHHNPHKLEFLMTSYCVTNP